MSQLSPHNRVHIDSLPSHSQGVGDQAEALLTAISSGLNGLPTRLTPNQSSTYDAIRELRSINSSPAIAGRLLDILLFSDDALSRSHASLALANSNLNYAKLFLTFEEAASGRNQKAAARIDGSIQELRALHADPEVSKRLLRILLHNDRETFSMLAAQALQGVASDEILEPIKSACKQALTGNRTCTHILRSLRGSEDPEVLTLAKLALDPRLQLATRCEAAHLLASLSDPIAHKVLLAQMARIDEAPRFRRHLTYALANGVKNGCIQPETIARFERDTHSAWRVTRHDHPHWSQLGGRVVTAISFLTGGRPVLAAIRSHTERIIRATAKNTQVKI